MNRIIISLFAICLGFHLTAGGRSEDTNSIRSGRAFVRSEKTHEVRALEAGKEVVLDLRTGGAIAVTSSVREEVFINIFKYGAAIEQAEINIEETSGGIRIMAWYPKDPRSNKYGVDMVLTVPSSCNLILDTLGGNVSVDGVEGNISGKTLGGDLTLSNLKGEINMETLGGDIDISFSTLNGHVKTLGGNIRVRELQGRLNADTLGGKVVYLDSLPNENTEPIKVDSLGGNINIDEAPAGIEARTLGGNINIGRAAEFVKAETLGGSIKINEFDGRIFASTLGGDVRAVMTGDPLNGERNAVMKSLGGDVSLTVPDGLSMDIEIVLKVTKDKIREPRIITDFDLMIEERETTRDERLNDIRKVITAYGTTGDGLHQVYLSTINGNIYLKRDN